MLPPPFPFPTFPPFYGQTGAVYRPHIDGAWPGSGLDKDGKYVFDAFGDRWSKLTFLV